MFISPSDTKNLIPIMPNYVEDFNGEQHYYGSQPVNSGNGPSGYGQYDQLFANNPYRNLNYKKSFWQAVAEGLGFRTSYDDRVEQAELNAREYDADVFALMQKNQYDSPLEQSERMRMAGLNPDLLGTGDVAEGASMRNDANGINFPVVNEANDILQIGSSVASGVMNLIPQVLSFATNIQQLKGIRVENDAKELSFGQNALQAAEDFFLQGVTEQEYKEAFEKNDWTNVLDASTKNAKYLADTFLSSKRARKAFNLAYGLHSNSLASKIKKYQSYDEFEKARKGLLSQRASSFFSDDDATMESLLNAFIGPTEQFNKTIAELNLKKAEMRSPSLEQGLENAQMSNQLEYEQAIDPSLQAQTENDTNRAVSQQQKILEATNKLFEDIMANLSKSDNWWSKIAMALVGIARSQLMSGMSMHFQRQNYQKVDGDTGVFTEESMSKSDFGM